MSIKSISQEPWRTLVNSSVAADPLEIPAVATSLPKTGIKRLTAPFFPTARFIFAGDGANTNAYNYQIVLWYTIAGGFIPVTVASGLVTLGPLTDATSAVLPTAGDLFADKITDTLGLANNGIGGVAIYNNEEDGIATIEVELRNATAIEVETDIDEASNVTVLYQLGESGQGFDQVTSKVAAATIVTAIGLLVQAG